MKSNAANIEDRAYRVLSAIAIYEGRILQKTSFVSNAVPWLGIQAKHLASAAAAEN